MKNDPYWLNARFASKCAKCSKVISRGERVFYYPLGKKAYCETCGQPMALEFALSVQDEGFMTSGGW